MDDNNKDNKDKVVSLDQFKREKEVEEAIDKGVQRLVDKWIGKYGANLPLILSHIQEIIYNEDKDRLEFQLKNGERLTEDDPRAKERRAQREREENNNNSEEE
tara:strand:+ start:64 stop:372 length:309 start_codon:yes stop_codon:yes gene_type:complete